jgi:hypothetical protein
MTRGILVSINHKRELYLNSKCSNDRGLKDFYKLYCKILTRVLREAKQLQYSRRSSTAKNKIKTTWKIVKSKTDRKIDIEEIPTISYNGLGIDDQQTMSRIFNDYFSSIAEKIMCTNITERITHLGMGDNRWSPN